MRKKVIDYPELERDSTTGLIVNVDRTSLQAAKAKKRRHLQTIEQIEEQKNKMTNIDHRLSRLENLLEKTLSELLSIKGK